MTSEVARPPIAAERLEDAGLKISNARLNLSVVRPPIAAERLEGLQDEPLGTFGDVVRPPIAAERLEEEKNGCGK